MRVRTGILALLTCAALAAAGAQDTSLGSFRDWNAMRYGAGASVACMAFSQPVKSVGNHARRGDAFVFVTNRPASGERGRVSVEAGYPYRPGSRATLTVGELTLELRTRGSTAWLEDDGNGRRLLQAMRAGREMLVKGTSDRGTETLDHYSLFGFTAAHDAIAMACPAR